ncbi:MAG: carbohydrate ABC transporter permease [Anaerolineaceae bacterium]|nr:carbohydrate ABC transporter permease [Anaerolineaceae bacterium]
MKHYPEIKKQNLRMTALLVLGLVLTLILMSLPLYTFEIGVYTKKSPNTFVGDEKYIEAKAEAEAAADEYRAQGFDVEVTESVLERTNSKGKTTSLVTFTVMERMGKNFWSFLGKDLPSSKVLYGILGLMTASLLFTCLGLAGSADLLHRYLDTRSRIFRDLTIAALFIAMVLIPVFILMNNVTFSRQLSLYNTGLVTEGKEAFFAKMDSFLFNGTMGEGIGDVLSGLKISHSALVWLMIPALFISLLAAFSIRKGEIQSSLLKLCLYIFVIIVCVITLYPYYVMLITAFRSNAESLDMYFLHIFPTKWIWSNLTDIIHRGVPRFLLNSLFVAGGATALAMLCGIPAAYALARMNFKGKKIFLGYVIMSQMFSPVVLLIGISQLMTTLHLNNTLWGLMLINAAFNQAFAIWLLRGTFVSISPEMEQAALIDGCGTVGALTKVLIPMAAPGIVTALIFVFINAWNEYTVATILISTAQYRPITVGITQFSSFNMIEWQYMFAASLLATIPVVILFMFIEKHLTAGLTSGGVKG